ncbi:MAG: MFS transporter [Spirochaetaceae bacterium]|nr:MAG: MFS transporter [Spirochaetaceae bacterium]
MSRKQLLLLFFGALVLWAVGNGTMPLIPVYALKLGASQAMTGYFLAFAFLALAVGTIFAGWLSDKLQRRKLLIIVSGAMLIASLWMMGQARNYWQFAAAYAATTFLFGIAVTLINVLAGLFAADNERGRVFGVLGLSIPVGAILGGLSVGRMVDRWGYPTMFAVLALISVILPMTTIFVKDKKIEQAPNHTTTEHREKPSFGEAFIILLIAHLIVIIVHGAGNIGRSFTMHNIGFAATAMTSTAVIGGVVSLPFPFILGRLSDRLGRKLLIIICYASYGLSMIIYALSKSLWHFWIGSAFFNIGMISNTVGTAFVTDLVDSKFLGRGVSLFQGMFWTANVIGLAVAGYVFQNVGISTAMLISATLPLIGIVLVLSIRVAKPSIAVSASPQPK